MIRFTLEWFPAVLRDAAGEELAEGRACFNEQSREVEFVSDFVPIYPLGTAMTIERVYRGEPVHVFDGSVYLSSKQLMRIVGVEDTLRYGAQYVYCTSLDLPAELTVVCDPPKKKRLRLFRREEPGPLVKSERVTVTAINHDSLTMLYSMSEPLQHGSSMSIRLLPPVPEFSAELELRDEFLFGSRASYCCAITSVTSGSVDDVGRYVFDNYPLDPEELLERHISFDTSDPSFTPINYLPPGEDEDDNFESLDIPNALETDL